MSSLSMRCSVILFAVLTATNLWPAEAPKPEHRADWMRRAHWGVMVHYLSDWIWEQEARAKGLAPEEEAKLASVESWNALVDGFDVEGLAKQLEEVGAGYFLLSIGQNSGYYLAPNPTYDRLVGIQPTKCSRRDLISDMADALAKRGIRMLVYLPSGAPNLDPVACRALQWTDGPYPNREFKTKWEAIVRDWSLRWGKKVSGWWFDGCYWPNQMYRGEAPNFATFAAAARAGNPDSIVAFNPGVYYPVVAMSPDQDYIAGEIAEPAVAEIVKDTRLLMRDGRYDGKMDGVQVHVLTYLGEHWGHAGERGRRPPFGEVRFRGREVVEFTFKVVAYGGAFTWDVPVQRNGRIPAAFLGPLRQLRDTLDTMAAAPGGEPPRRSQ